MNMIMGVDLFLILLQLKIFFTEKTIFHIIWWRSEKMEKIPLMGQVIFNCYLVVKLNN